MDKAIHLVDFHVFDLKVHKSFLQEVFAMFARRFKDIQHGVFVQAGESGNGADAYAFTKHDHDQRNFVRFDSDARKGLALAECFTAFEAAVSLNDSIFILEVAETSGFALAAMTCHLTLSRRRHKVTVFRKKQQLWA